MVELKNSEQTWNWKMPTNWFSDLTPTQALAAAEGVMMTSWQQLL